jgi:hypothetical protein
MKIRWKIVRSSPIKSDTKSMSNWMLRPINSKELEPEFKKQVRNHFNKTFTDWLEKRWKYNIRQGDCMWKNGFDKNCITQTLTLLSIHHEHWDIETPYQLTDFKELDWKIMVPKTNEESRKISLHNFTIFKDQIILNQHNALYNNKLMIGQKLTSNATRNEKIIQELLPYLQDLTTRKEDFKNECAITLEYINSFKKYSIINWKYYDTTINLRWQYNLETREINQTHSIKCKLKSHKQIQLIQEMRKLEKNNKNWNKVINNERAILQKMSANDFNEKLHYCSVRNVIKKEIWKLAMKEVKELKNPMKAKYAKQILFY